MHYSAYRCYWAVLVAVASQLPHHHCQAVPRGGWLRRSSPLGRNNEIGQQQQQIVLVSGSCLVVLVLGVAVVQQGRVRAPLLYCYAFLNSQQVSCCAAFVVLTHQLPPTYCTTVQQYHVPLLLLVLLLQYSLYSQCPHCTTTTSSTPTASRGIPHQAKQPQEQQQQPQDTTMNQKNCSNNFFLPRRSEQCRERLQWCVFVKKVAAAQKYALLVQYLLF